LKLLVSKTSEIRDLRGVKMKIKLYKIPKNPIILEGFPGFGLVGTIATEFLIDNLKTELIGKIWLDELPAMVAIHDSKVVEPIGIHYNKKHNLILIHGVAAVKGIEWVVADAILEIAKKVKAKEIISIEGVGSATPNESPTCYYYSSDNKKSAKLKKAACQELKEGIIMGVTGAMLVRGDDFIRSCVFAETHSNLPDSKAAAEVIKILDKYLGLKVDFNPLLQQSEVFEDKLKNIMQKGQEAEKLQEQKELSYMG
jgi:uncharacterized protein